MQARTNNNYLHIIASSQTRSQKKRSRSEEENENGKKQQQKTRLRVESQRHSSFDNIPQRIEVSTQASKHQAKDAPSRKLVFQIPSGFAVTDQHEGVLVGGLDGGKAVGL